MFMLYKGDKMKVIRLPLFALIIGLAVTLIACGDDIKTPPTVTSVSISPKPNSVRIGEPTKLSALVEGTNLTDKSVLWSSSDKSFATVNNGVITGIAEGQVTITATSTANPNKSDSLSLEIVEALPSGNGATKADYNAYNQTLPTWAEFSPRVPEKNEATGPTNSFNELLDGLNYACTSTPYSLSTTPEKIVTFDPGVGTLWVGSLIQGKSYLGGVGSMAEVPVRERQPLTIFIDKIGPDISKTVINPDAATVQTAMSELVLDLQSRNIPLSTEISYKEVTTNSLEEATLKLGLSIKYGGARLKTSLETQRSRSQTTVTAHFVQELFTIAIVVPQTPADFFSNEFSQEDLAEQQRLGRIGEDNVPVYVANVTYGRILHFTFTSTANETTIKRILNAQYKALSNSGSLELSDEDKRVLQESEIKVVTVGGDETAAVSIIKSGDLKQYFNNAASLSTAKPISYTVRNLGDGTIAAVSETTSYMLETCGKPAPQRFLERLTGSARTDNSVFGGERRWWRSGLNQRSLENGSYYIVDSFSNVREVFTGSDGYCNYSFPDQHDIQDSSGKTLKVAHTITWEAGVRSPSGRGNVGTITCKFEGSYVTY
jgi:hypothetical protein